jgi:hypothetical protein
MGELLTPLLFYIYISTGLSSVWSLKHSGTEDSHDLKEESPREETNRSPLLHHLVKRYLLPRTPPFHGKLGGKVLDQFIHLGNAE